MSDLEKPHYSRATLTRSERLQQKFGDLGAYRAIARLTVGSKSPAYRESVWRSGDIETQIRSTVEVPGDPKARGPARLWHSALVMTIDNPDREEIEKQIGDDATYHEAVAYISEGVVHVGTLRRAIETDRQFDVDEGDIDAYLDTFLFASLEVEENAVAMRIGKGPLEATMGLWLPEQNLFTGAENVCVVNAKANISDLHIEYPGIHLV